MLQSLLADRFKLKVHHETRPLSVYALVAGKSGPKFKPSTPEEPSVGRFNVNGRIETMTFTTVSMDDLADALTGSYSDRPIIDKTGLTGNYDIKLEATPQSRITRDPQPADLSIFTAVQEQLGLKLEPTKAPVDVLVVDHIEKPSEN
jgi:uncharacterized protein (TIGR03435 family)